MAPTKDFKTTGKTVPVLAFKLDGVELRAYKPKKALLLEMAELVGISDIDVENLSDEERRMLGDTASMCLSLIPKVFDQESAAHLESRFYDPSDPFDLMPSEEDPDYPSAFGILMWLMGEMSKKDESPASKTGSPSRAGSPRRSRASTVTARSKAAASTTARSRTKD